MHMYKIVSLSCARSKCTRNVFAKLGPMTEILSFTSSVTFFVEEGRVRSSKINLAEQYAILVVCSLCLTLPETSEYQHEIFFHHGSGMVHLRLCALE